MKPHEQVRKLLKANPYLSNKKLAEHVEKTTGAVAAIIHRHKIPRKRRIKWTRKRLMRLATLSARGFSASHIAELEGESIGAIKGVMSAHGLFARGR